MVSLKIQYEMACRYQEYESLQLVVSQALGGKIEEPNGSKSIVGGEPVEDMNGLMSMIHTIGGKIG